MAEIRIAHIPPETWARIKAAAALHRVTIERYLLDLLQAHATAIRLDGPIKKGAK